MSKRDFKKYIKGLKKADLEEQMLDLYERFDEVKTFYNFVFNPNEDKLVREAKEKVSNEYFPTGRRKKAKQRRSIPKKYIRHFLKLEMEPYALADFMLFNVEIAQSFSAEKGKMTEAFERSMFKFFEQAAEFIIANGMTSEFIERIHKIEKETEVQNWDNHFEFQRIGDRFL